MGVRRGIWYFPTRKDQVVAAEGSAEDVRINQVKGSLLKEIQSTGTAENVAKPEDPKFKRLKTLLTGDTLRSNILKNFLTKWLGSDPQTLKLIDSFLSANNESIDFRKLVEDVISIYPERKILVTNEIVYKLEPIKTQLNIDRKKFKDEFILQHSINKFNDWLEFRKTNPTGILEDFFH